MKKNNLQIEYVIDTHTHVDHISLPPDLARIFNARTVMNTFTPSQREIGAKFNNLFGIKKIIAENAARPVDLFIHEADALTVGQLTLAVLHTPGHTKDSMCLLRSNRIFTGDALII